MRRSVLLMLLLALTMTVSAFASDAQPYNADATKVTALVNAGAQTYSVTVTAPSDATKVKFDATLYQKQLIGRKEISSMSAGANGRTCAKSQSAAVESGKTYVIEVSAQVYSGGTWDTIERTIAVKT